MAWGNILCPEVPKREIKMGEIEENWQPAKFYCSEIKLIYSTFLSPREEAKWKESNVPLKEKDLLGFWNRRDPPPLKQGYTLEQVTLGSGMYCVAVHRG